jgi:uncharacterized protein (TIGR02284 family)
MTTTTNTPTNTTTSISSAHVGLLNDLLQLNRDSVEGFTKAIEWATSPKLKAICQSALTERQAAVLALEPLVRAAGGFPDKSLSVSGALHRTWMKVRESVSPNGDEALILEVERAEDEMRDAYVAAMKQALPPMLKDVIAAQSKEVLAVHDTFCDLKHGRRTL